MSFIHFYVKIRTFVWWNAISNTSTHKRIIKVLRGKEVKELQNYFEQISFKFMMERNSNDWNKIRQTVTLRVCKRQYKRHRTSNV